MTVIYAPGGYPSDSRRRRRLDVAERLYDKDNNLCWCDLVDWAIFNSHDLHSIHAKGECKKDCWWRPKAQWVSQFGKDIDEINRELDALKD